MTSKNETRKEMFAIGQKVYISNDVNLFRERQKSCGGFSETNMIDILGSMGVVKCVKRKCVTVEVNKRQFDINSDLLSTAQYSLPSPTMINSCNMINSITNEIPVNNNIPVNNVTCVSLPEPSIEDILSSLLNAPRDESINSIENSTKQFPSLSRNIYKVTNCDTTLNESLMDPPQDQEELLSICFDGSQVVNLNEVKTMEFQTIPISSQISNETIPIPSQNPSQATQMDSSLETIPIPSKTFTEKPSGSSHPKQITCLNCCTSIINYALPCGHCYCTNCHYGLNSCVKCSNACTNWIKIHLQI